MSMTCYGAADDVSADGFLEAAERGSWETEPRRRRGSSWRDRAIFVAFIAPGLFAEVAPLILFWNVHLPISQMSVMMVGAWGVAWWLTWIIALPLSTRRRGLRGQNAGRGRTACLSTSSGDGGSPARREGLRLFLAGCDYAPSR